MKEFSVEDKDKLLLMHKYTKIVGYAMDYASDDEKVIITLDEIRKWVGEPAQAFYFEENNDEYARDLDDAWETLFDELYNTLDTGDYNKVNKYLVNKLNEFGKSGEQYARNDGTDGVCQDRKPCTR